MICRLKLLTHGTGVKNLHFYDQATCRLFLILKFICMQTLIDFVYFRSPKKYFFLNFAETCRDPGTPQNSRRIGSDLRHGKTIKFLCLHGFTLRGVSSITCNDGKWSSENPVCSGNQRRFAV